MELLNLSEEKLIILLQMMNNSDEINNIFMNNYWNKIGIFVKLMREVFMKWKKRSDFKAHHSMQFRGENWSKIETLSLNSQPRFKNCRMKLIVWMIRDFQNAESEHSGQFHIANQPAFFQPFPDPGGMLSRSTGMPSRKNWAAKHLGHAWFFGKRFL